MRKLHTPEWVKNLLLIGLSLSAVYLFTLSPLYLNSPLYGWTGRLRPTGPDSAGEQVSFSAAARPARMAVTNSAGRYAAQYDNAAVDALFDQTGTLLGEALGSAGEAQPVSEAQWRRALGEEGIYFDFDGSVPLSALAGWLRDGEKNGLLSGDARRMVLAAGGDGAVWLYYQDTQDKKTFYGRATALRTQAHLSPVTGSFAPNGAKFAFEMEDMASCGPYTLIAEGTASAPVYAAASPLPSGGEALDVALSALSFSGALVTSYDADDGTVFRQGEDFLQLGSDGSLSYHGGNGELYPVAREGEAPTLAEMIEATRKLTAAVLEPLCGEARVYLISTLQEENITSITYGYSLNGAAVWTGRNGWCAQFQLRNGAITGFTLFPRTYTALEISTPLLPVAQAAAAMEAEGAAGSDLTLIYRDTGEGEARAGWVAL